MGKIKRIGTSNRIFTRNHAIWSLYEEHELLRLYTKGLSLWEIANKLQRNVNSINSRLKVLQKADIPLVDTYRDRP